MFDGVHLGHQHVIRQAHLDARALGARAVVVTFDPHPLAIVAPDRAPQMLQSLAERLRIFEILEMDAALVVQFTAEVSHVTGESFVRELARGFGRVRSCTVGEGFQFGHRRSGDVPLLQRLGQELDFVVHAAAPIQVSDEIVSSTRIRGVLRAGELALVAELLGRPYTVAGQVQHGDQLGRQLGFATANLEVTGLELPPLGRLIFKDAETGEVVEINTNDLRKRSAFAERQTKSQAELLRMLRSANIDTMQLRTDQPYAGALGKFFETREKRHRHG